MPLKIGTPVQLFSAAREKTYVRAVGPVSLVRDRSKVVKRDKGGRPLVHPHEGHELVLFVRQVPIKVAMQADVKVDIGEDREETQQNE